MNRNGVIFYRGPSLLDGAPIVGIMTGLQSDSANSKTGALLQTWILRADLAPNAAIRSGADVSICGDCPHRGDGTGAGRSCYVQLRAPVAVYRAFERGSYADMSDDAGLSALEWIIRGRALRCGAYGDPAAIPAEVWQRLTAAAGTWTGYTHAWRTCAPALRPLLMASVDTPWEAAAAHAAGWRTFRVTVGADPVAGLEILCPASEEAGKRTTCDRCTLCKGSSIRARSIVIRSHGAGRKHAEAFSV